MVGKVTISIELELGWGKHDIPSYDCFSSNRSEESKYFKKLIDACEQAELPITFDIVGHLFRKSCDTRDESLYSSGWWNEHDNSNESTERLFHAPDLVQEIKDTSVNHEFATHTYTHIMLDEACPELISHEFDLVQDVHNEWNIDPPVSLVAPRHRKCDPKLLCDNGIQIIREPSLQQSEPTYLLSSWLLTRSHPIQDPEMKNGVLRTYSTSYPSLTYSGGILPKGQLPSQTHFQYIPVQIRQLLHEKYLKEAVRTAITEDSHVHLWTHLWNLSNKYQWETVDSFITWLRAKIDTGEIEIYRMKDLVKEGQ